MRVNGRVVTKYVGGGEFGRLFEAEGRRDRDERESGRRRDREALAEWTEADARVDAYCDAVEMAYRDAMTGAGFHRPQRGRWRRKRVMGKRKALEASGLKPIAELSDAELMERMEQAEKIKQHRERRERSAVKVPGKRGGKAKAKAARPPATKTTEADWTPDHVQEVADRLQDGDKAAVAEWNRILKGDWRKSILDCCGSPSVLAIESIARSFHGKDALATVESMKAGAEDKYKSLVPADAHPLEKLLTRRVVVCWYAVHQAEHHAAQNGSVPIQEYWERRLDRCHRRLLSSIRALASFRKIGMPSVLVAVQGDMKMDAPSPDNGTDPAPE